jgi:hypothetical protein
MVRPIRVGDKFLTDKGDIFEVVEDRCFGRVTIFDRKRSRSSDTYKRFLRTWKRFEDLRE